APKRLALYSTSVAAPPVFAVVRAWVRQFVTDLVHVDGLQRRAFSIGAVMPGEVASPTEPNPFHVRQVDVELQTTLRERSEVVGQISRFRTRARLRRRSVLIAQHRPHDRTHLADGRGVHRPPLLHAHDTPDELHA